MTNAFCLTNKINLCSKLVLKKTKTTTILKTSPKDINLLPMQMKHCQRFFLKKEERNNSISRLERRKLYNIVF